MVQEVGYRRQLGTAGPAGLPQAGAGAFGADVGAGVAAIGSAMGRADELERRNRADSEAADFNARFALAREDADKASIDARANAAPGGVGHADQTSKWWEDRQARLLEGVTDPRVRRSAEAQLAEFGGRYRAAEYQWQEGARVGKLVSDTQAATAVAGNRAYRQHDPKSFAEELSLGRQAIEAMPGVPADVREKLVRQHDETVSIGFLNGVVDTNPKAIAPLLDSGQFDGLVTMEQADRLRGGAQAEMHRRDAQLRAVAAQDRQVERDALGALEEGYNAGAGTYQDRLTIATRYAAIGDQSKAEQWRGKAAEFATVQGSRDWTIPQLDARISTLAGKQNGGGLSSAEAHELAGLRDQRQQGATRLNQPGGALAQMQYATGRALDPVDLTDPASMRRRAGQAVAAAQTYGRSMVEPLMDAELAGLKDLANGSAVQRLQALDSIRGFGDPRAIAGAARQIAGAGDGAFRIAATLNRQAARDVLAGDEVLKTNAGVWDQVKALAVLNRYYGKPLNYAGDGYRPDVMEAAKSLYATRMTRGGETAWNDGRFAEAIEAVMGRTVDASGTVRGGVARTAQGVVLVPAGVRPEDLMQTFARATPQAYAKAAGGRAPRWADGTAMREREFKQLLPTAIGGGRYGFRTPDGGLVHDDRGDIYAVRLAELK